MSTATPRPEELTAGATLGPYTLEELLGEGGMGVVFRARRVHDGEPVALKVLRPELCEDDIYRRRFVHEARSASAVRHPHLVPILEAGSDAGRPYLAAALVHGRTLRDRVALGPLPQDELLRVAVELGSALDALHAAGIVHRDVKTANVLQRTGDGASLLTDFGLATAPSYTALTKRGQVLGSIDYLAPELIRGERGSPATDLYAFGCLLYECAAGRLPFAGRSPLQVGLAHLDEEPPDPVSFRPELPPALGPAMTAALRKDPAQRPPSPGAYADTLRLAAGTA